MTYSGKSTLCWKCIHAVPDKHGHGCSWSKEFKPVEGWEAEKTVITNYIGSQGKKIRSSYMVIRCPEFKPDEPMDPKPKPEFRPVREVDELYKWWVEAFR